MKTVKLFVSPGWVVTAKLIKDLSPILALENLQ